MRYSRTKVLLLVLLSLTMCFVTSASSSKEDPSACSLSIDQLTTERRRRRAIIQVLHSIKEQLDDNRPEKVRINCGARFGGSYSPALGVFEALQEKLQGEYRVDLEFSKDNSEGAGYYTGEKGLSTEEGLKRFVSLGKKIKMITKCISVCLSCSSYFSCFSCWSCLFRKQARDYINEKIAPVVPDMIYVSTVPSLHSTIAKYSAKAKELGTPILCVPCDAGELYEGSWVVKNPKNILYFLFCRAQIERAQRFGCKYIKISGLPLRPEFRDIHKTSKAEMKKKLGFLPDEPLVLVFFGAAGSHRTREIAEILKDVNLVIICGKDDVSKEELESIGNPKHRVLGFASAKEVAECTGASDFVVGKTGGSQTAEAAHCKCVFMFCKKYALPWERCNADWLLDQNIGKELESWHELPAAIAEVMKNKADYEKRFAELNNNGAEEVANVIAEMVNNGDMYKTWQDKLWGKKGIDLG